MSRKAFTLIETLVAGTLGLTVLGAALSLGQVGERMNRTASLSATLASARLLEEALTTDLRQMATGAGTDVLRVTASGVTFRVTRFTPSGLALDAVRWQRITDARGTVLLTRTYQHANGSRDHRVLSVAPLIAARFALLAEPGTGARFLRLDFQPLDERGSEPYTLFMGLRPSDGPGIPPLAPSLAVTAAAPLFDLAP